MRNPSFIIALLVFCSTILLGGEDSAAVVMVNGTAVTQPEIAFFLSPYRGEIERLKELKNKAGESGINTILQSVIDKSIGDKLQLLDAVKFGIIPEASFRSIHEARMRENVFRRTAKADNKIIYGPVEFSESAFYEYYMSQIIVKVKDSLTQNAIDISEARLLAFYDSVRDSMFRRHDAFTLLQVIAKTIDGEKLRGLRNKAGEVNDPLLLMKLYPCEASVLTIDDEQYRVYSEDRENMLRAATKLHTGELSDWFTEGKEKIFLKCLGRERSGYISFEEAKGIIQSKIIDRDYDERLREMRSHAKINLNRSVIKKFATELMPVDTAGGSQAQKEYNR